MSITDAYPTATQDGVQIRMDLVRPNGLWAIPIPITTGSIPVVGILNASNIYEFRATADCIIDFTAVAISLPYGNLAIQLRAGETMLVTPPVTVTGISVLGLSATGLLYIAEYVNWAGLANDTTLGNQ
jgi:hypothetical protein